MGTILLFYKYIHIPNPTSIMNWQRTLCQDLQLKGRIILAHEGINGTIGGTIENTELYKKAMLEHELFAGIDFKEAPGDASYFPKLRIVVKDEIVNLGIDPNKLTANNGGVHLKPAQAHELIKQNPENLVILDARNRFESKVGTFTGAITPDIPHFRDLPEYIDNNVDQFKDKQVLMFCTGGIRCERASAYLKQKQVAQQVYQIEGGIHRYIEQFPDGFFRGKNYVFDGRVTVKVNDDIIGSCDICGISCDDITNCLNASCNKHFICCPQCFNRFNNTCSQTCMELLATDKVKPRPLFKKADSTEKPESNYEPARNDSN
ncbi:MAG TPA: rhodanese-related sulfurtransferase [Candidatus Babeliales bacterium]|nr:rhodanese-related sulfurtransferase [Candidatus Babeliales bacterium]